ncbi:hypothetical protein DFA_02835 [Cavenderia fasciculata]|uniref:Uncharacterized protein n=1 Tax=Cavenderia fasciculata TaxID=261658 RepID=F4PIL2_CACFS|nr:uncharacterized protein DFA_02835 [Cavenderia fasciculata]EGG24592.1 hypothetical protein DFA_02835 [Cavenderia fasciculata]|eukprot:XP_004362443.1 hypothetical protein DFA_02835 [Cavenderia fasciculata]
MDVIVNVVEEQTSITPIPMGDNEIHNQRFLRSIRVANGTDDDAIVYTSSEGCPFRVAQDGTITQNVDCPSVINLASQATSELHFLPTTTLVHIQTFITKKGQGRIYVGHREVTPGVTYRICKKHLDPILSAPYRVYDENFSIIATMRPFAPTAFINHQYFFVFTSTQISG